MTFDFFRDFLTFIALPGFYCFPNILSFSGMFYLFCDFLTFLLTFRLDFLREFFIFVDPGFFSFRKILKGKGRGKEGGLSVPHLYTDEIIHG